MGLAKDAGDADAREDGAVAPEMESQDEEEEDDEYDEDEDDDMRNYFLLDLDPASIEETSGDNAIPDVAKDLENANGNRYESRPGYAGFAARVARLYSVTDAFELYKMRLALASNPRFARVEPPKSQETDQDAVADPDLGQQADHDVPDAEAVDVITASAPDDEKESDVHADSETSGWEDWIVERHIDPALYEAWLRQRASCVDTQGQRLQALALLAVELYVRNLLADRLEALLEAARKELYNCIIDDSLSRSGKDALWSFALQIVY